MCATFVFWRKSPPQWFDRTSQSFVKKKAALTLLRLYRKHPQVIPAAEWALRIVSIMDDHDLVIILAMISVFYIDHT